MQVVITVLAKSWLQTTVLLYTLFNVLSLTLLSTEVQISKKSSPVMQECVQKLIYPPYNHSFIWVFSELREFLLGLITPLPMVQKVNIGMLRS